MKKIILTLLIISSFGCSLFISESFSQSSWIFQSYADSAYLPSLRFLNENTGYILGYKSGSGQHGFFYNTTNGGINWITKPLPTFMNLYLYTLCFLDVNTGYVTGYSNKIFKTNDGGNNWSYNLAPYYSLGNQTYTAIQFFNENTGFIGGRYGFRAKTTNGGNNWITLDTALAQIIGIYFFNENTGFMSDVFSDVYKTTNGGMNWQFTYLKDSLGVEYAYIDIKFINLNTGYLLGANNGYGALFRTTNCGNNWKDILILENTPFNSLFVLDSSTIFIGCETNKILKSTNKGATWSVQYLSNATPYVSVFFLNTNIGYACAYNHILKTTNGGNVFIRNVSSEYPNHFILYQNYPNPFNPTTKIKFDIPANIVGQTFLSVYDITGREIQTLVNESLQPGSYEVTFDGSNLASGVYFYRIQSEDFVSVKRMVLIK